MSKKVIIGSRGSDLALWQAYRVKSQLEDLGCSVELDIILTQGDKIQDLSFDKMEGKGFFTKEIEEALLNKKIDLAVHSHKDLETNPPRGLIVAAVSDREDPSELLLIKKEAVNSSKRLSLQEKAIVGTSSARRKSQLLAFRSDIEIKELRGNVPTRINKLREGDYDAIMLAKAGVTRLKIDLSEFHVITLDPKEFIPAPAQGVLGLQIRESDAELFKLLQQMNDRDVQKRIYIERKVLNLLDGGCQLPLGVYCEEEYGIMKTWVSQAETSEGIPKRLYVENTSAEEIVKLLKTKESKRIFISRELKSDSDFKRFLPKGFKLHDESLIEIIPVPFEETPESDWIFFSSSNAVSAFFENKPSYKDGTKFGVIGKATGKALAKYAKADYIGKGNTQKVAKRFVKALGKGSVLFPVSDKSVRTIQKKLPKTQVTELIVYKTIQKLEFKLPESDILIFTSPSNVEAFFNTENSISGQRVISIGETTRKELLKHNVNSVVPWQSYELAMLDLVLAN